MVRRKITVNFSERPITDLEDNPAEWGLMLPTVIDLFLLGAAFIQPREVMIIEKKPGKYVLDASRKMDYWECHFIYVSIPTLQDEINITEDSSMCPIMV